MTLPFCRVLLVEDNRPDALLIEEMLLKSRATVGALSESDLTVIPMAAAAR